ncbi:MAG: hypothetical protein MUE62_09310 [Burkholderiaceae bacterium]|nr:hypothetical protein [Burkholderiaceae bacterium]
MRLRADADRAARPEAYATGETFGHQRPAEPGAAHLGRRDHAADRRLGVLHAGVDDAEIRLQRAAGVAAEQVPAELIGTVGVEVHRLLLDGEHAAAQLQRVVQGPHAEVVDA